MQTPVQVIIKATLKLIPYLIIAVLVLLLFRQCRVTENVYTFLENEKQEVQVYKNKLGTLTNSVNASELSNKQLKELLSKKDDTLKKLMSEFKEVRNAVKIQEVVRVDSVFVPYEFDIDCEFKRFGKYDTDSHFKFDYSLNETGFSLSNIEIPNTQTIITGTKRNWIFGKQYLTTDITNSNDYIQTKEVQSVVIPVSIEWYNNKWLYLGFGLCAGVLIAK